MPYRCTAKTSPSWYGCSMSRREALVLMSELAADQWGLLTSAQAKKLGVSANDLTRLGVDQVIRPVRHGVYAMVGAPASPLETVRAEWLATDPQHTVSELSLINI